MEISKLYKQGGSVVVAIPIAVRRKAKIEAGDSLVISWNENVKRITLQKLVLGKGMGVGWKVDAK